MNSTYYAIPADVLDVIAPQVECGACGDAGKQIQYDPHGRRDEWACPDCHGTGHTRALRWETLVEVMDGAPFARVNDGWEPLETMDEPENRQTWAAWERLDDKSDGLYALMPERECDVCEDGVIYKDSGMWPEFKKLCPHCTDGTRPAELVQLVQVEAEDEYKYAAVLKMPEGEVIE